ncbi:ATP-binding protein [Paenibacillus sp. GCM10027626]|uniref:sensor histidine kinase n=1 Tax=Paenibacillus sp. GCM10027626 TaxID=3273411 RepID=UPI0036292125
MKFWQKSLLLVLALFIIALDISVLMIMNKSWALNIAREQQRADREQALIANNIYENLNSIASRGMLINEAVLAEVARSYIDYYHKQKISLQLWDHKQDQLIYADDRESIAASNEIAAASELPAPYGHIELVYKRNIEELYASQAELNRYFVYINCTAGPLLALALYVLIRRLTKPLRQLSSSTETIAAGNYSERIALRNNDEFGELAQNFNQMAEAVERHVTELSDMAEEKQRIVDNLAHELRTPLTSMQGFAQYLNSANIGEEERVTASGHIWNETLRLKNLVFKLLELSTLRGQPIERTEVNVEELFAAVQQMEGQNLEHAGLKLVVERTIASVWGDADLLKSFLVNCIENAIHASSAGSEISLKAFEHWQEQEQRSSTVLEVRDFGKGMSAEHLKHVFEPFYRVDHARSRKHGGAGLGLSICRQIADAHDARLELESMENEGSAIRILLQLPNK